MLSILGLISFGSKQRKRETGGSLVTKCSVEESARLINRARSSGRAFEQDTPSASPSATPSQEAGDSDLTASRLGTDRGVFLFFPLPFPPGDGGE
jgi:hypothetical protein